MRKIRLFHFDIPTLNNYGDNLLFEMVKCSFESFSNKAAFEVVQAQNLRSCVQEKTVDFINENCDAVLIGGGGLLLIDTNKNTNSGWQWNCSVEMLKKIQKPIVAFAIGNNRFRGQADFSGVFREHFNLFVEKSIFVGMRNHGSIEKTRPYLETKELQSKLTYQPCPTALISKLIPNYQYRFHTPRKEVYFQIAMDRPSLRFPEGKDVFFEKIYNSIEILSQQGWQVGILEFAGMDKDFTNFVKERSKEFPHIKLQHNTEVLNGLNAISSLPFIIAMRGHGVMIPFGLGVPTLSLVSHDKVAYFLHDTELQDLSVDVLEDNFQENIVEKLNGMYNNFDSIIERFSTAQEKITSITLNNLSNIYKTITSKQPENESFLCKELSEIKVSIDRRNIRFYKEEVAAQKRKSDVLKNRVDQRNKELESQKKKVAAQKVKIKEQRDDIGAQRAEIKEQRDEIGTQRAEIKEQRDEIDAQNKKIKVRINQNKKLKKEVSRVVNSRSWKITRPLRKTKSLVKSLYKKAKTKASRSIFFMFQMLPIKSSLIIFESHRALSYSCNPKYIYEAMLEANLDFTFVWFFSKPGHSIKGPAKQVKRFTIRYYYYLARAKFLIHNAEFAQNLPVRKKQIYINTQHGTPLKKMGTEMISPPKSVKSPNYTKDGRWSFLITQNNYSTNIFRRALCFNGPILELGYPRNDIFYKRNDTKSILELKEKFGLPSFSKVILYAPTWRGNKKTRTRNNFSLELDIERLYDEFSKTHVIILRLHHLNSLKLKIDEKFNEFVYNFSDSKYDIQELCLVSDMLITDYSSVMFDYTNLNRPQIFYAYDLEQYENELRGMYFNIEEEGPGPVVETMDELIDTIENIDEIWREKYNEKHSAFHEKFCYLDDGRASERVIDQIIKKNKKVNQKKNKKINLFFRKRNYKERVGKKTNYNLFLQFPVKRCLSKGKFIRDTSPKFPRFMNKLKEKGHKKAIILGNAECLNELEHATLNFLEASNFLTIGLNRSIYKFQTDLLIWSDLLTIKDILHKNAVKREDCHILHVLHERNHKLPATEDPDFHYLHEYWTQNGNFENWPKTKLYMFRNVLTAAFFLCYKLNIREIILVGFGFDDRQYFYKTRKYKKAKDYEIRSEKQLDENCGGYDTQKIIREILEYLIKDEQFHISYNGDSKFLAGIDGLNRIDLNEICPSQVGI